MPARSPEPESVQEWEVKVRQASSLFPYALTDEMCRNKFVFGLHNGTIRAELLKTPKSDGAPKSMQDVVAKAKALASAQKANKLILDATKGVEEQVSWISLNPQMKPCQSGSLEPAFGAEIDVDLTLGKHVLKMAKHVQSVQLMNTFPESVLSHTPATNTTTENYPKENSGPGSRKQNPS